MTTEAMGIYLDEFGLPVTAADNGGDSAQRLGFIAMGQYLRQKQGVVLDPAEPFHEKIQIERVLKYLVPSPGVLVRTPRDPWNDPRSLTQWATSRDQTLVFVAMLDLYNFRDEVVAFYNAHAMRFFV